jgi:hypothetical protein
MCIRGGGVNGRTVLLAERSRGRFIMVSLGKHNYLKLSAAYGRWLFKDITNECHWYALRAQSLQLCHFTFPIVWKKCENPEDFKVFTALHRVTCTCIYK